MTCKCGPHPEQPLPGKYVTVQKPDGTKVKMWYIDESALAVACGVGCKRTYTMPASGGATVIDFAEAKRLMGR